MRLATRGIPLGSLATASGSYKPNVARRVELPSLGTTGGAGTRRSTPACLTVSHDSMYVLLMVLFGFPPVCTAD
jgi:hypothetical protein